MDDLISRRAAIDATWEEPTYNDPLNVLAEVRDRLKALPSAQPDLDEWCTDCKEYNREKHCCPRWNRVIRETAEEVRKNTEQRWIPVTEQLPEDEQEVLVTRHFLSDNQLKKNAITESFYVEVASRMDEEWRSYSDEYKIKRHLHKVIAWMPLPKPYERSEDGSETD